MKGKSPLQRGSKPKKKRVREGWECEVEVEVGEWRRDGRGEINKSPGHISGKAGKGRSHLQPEAIT